MKLAAHCEHICWPAAAPATAASLVCCRSNLLSQIWSSFDPSVPYAEVGQGAGLQRYQQDFQQQQQQQQVASVQSSTVQLLGRTCRGLVVSGDVHSRQGLTDCLNINGGRAAWCSWPPSPLRILCCQIYCHISLCNAALLSCCAALQAVDAAPSCMSVPLAVQGVLLATMNSSRWLVLCKLCCWNAVELHCCGPLLSTAIAVG
jgi:hypothetical protein